MPLYRMMLKSGSGWETVRLITAPDAAHAMKVAEALRQVLASADSHYAVGTVCVEEVEPLPDKTGGCGDGGREDRQSFKGGCGG